MNWIENILIQLKEFYFPAGRRIPYRVFLIPLLIFMLVLATFSLIRPPTMINPAPGAQLSSSPVFQFRVTKNLFYQSYKVRLVYSASGREIPIVPVEERGVVTVTLPGSIIPHQEVRLLITINKGIGGVTLWKKTFSYRFRS